MYAASRSSLFSGNVLSHSVRDKHNSSLSCDGQAHSRLACTQSSDTHRLKVRDVVARIHGTLVIAPSAPTCPSSTSSGTSSADLGRVELSTDTVADQIEIPFVPAGERQGQPRGVETVKDTIVVVGQPARKKRKREKKIPVGASASVSATPPREESEPAKDETPFDYSAVSNILDDGSDHEPTDVAGSARKRKQRPQGELPSPCRRQC